ncbi:MAG TPA: efflux RND transporter permease subunit [candidate division Zixibacteria bacterium]|nr:efflux RND transporter permease subunit [candidate division Zixibacteria bacterium]MDD4918068.1 efflux RND transporter permease subunit [candidate division Zixibacteria bacterium]MDM7971757.1 efflux RND transporter permease subunit [candidate division Zixibacteria bacterium]HPM37414.1 efflux RND transporter permease subunit [candidate division Zixibacteria bacterium]
MKLSEVAVGRPVFTTMMMAALLVLGLASYTELPIDLMPDIEFPYSVIQTVYPGASAETVESEVTSPLEDEVNLISGIRHIESRSLEGYSLVIIEFELERDAAEATQEVREKVAGIRSDLPDDIEEPMVLNFDPTAFPIMSLAVSGDRTPRDLTTLAKDVVKERLQTISGVGGVALVGGHEREILLALDLDRMETFGVAAADVRKAVAEANMEIPGGRIDEHAREYLVRLAGRLPRVEDFEDVIVKSTGGAPVYLGDIARVIDTTVEQRSFSSFNRVPAVSLTVTKQAGTNTVEMADLVRETVGDLNRELPSDVKVEIVEDVSTFIRDSVHEIQFNILFGTLLAVIVIFLFLLDGRPTVITALAIPISLIATFAVMNFFGFTINIMTLLGLSLAVGILVDDAIVVIENIYRHMAGGRTAFQAAISGTKEIGLAVMATTFSIVVVFLPVAFMEGIVGRFFFEFGVTVAFAVLASLFVAFSLTPMLSARWLRAEAAQEEAAAKGRRVGARLYDVLLYWNRAFDWLKPRYRTLLEKSLRARWVVVLVAAAAFVLAFVIPMIGLVGVEFMTETDQNQLAIDIETAPGTTLAETVERFQLVERTVRETLADQVTNTFITIGRGSDPVTRGRLLVQLIDRSERELSARQLMDTVRAHVAGIPGLEASVSVGESEAGGNKSIEISVQGPEHDEVVRLARRLQAYFYDVPGVVDVDNTLVEGKPEIAVTYDRRLASDLGISLQDIPMTVRWLVEGDVVTRFKEGDEEYDVRMRLDERFRQSTENLGSILIKSDKSGSDGAPLLVPLERVAQLRKTAEISEYYRYNRQREIRVNANVTSTQFPGTATNLIMEKFSAEVGASGGYVVAPVGQQEIMEESFRNILRALFLAVIFIYLLLASQYESFWDPFSIMLSLPLSLVGAIIGLIGSSFSIMSLIGIVLLMGLVTKNAILLIDFVKQERAKGVSRTDAILAAGPVRLRPIMMTTLAMAFGMLPLALGIGPGAELRAPMARAVIGGITSSMLLTLVVVPVVYTLIDDAVGLFRRKKAPGAVLKEDSTVRG